MANISASFKSEIIRISRKEMKSVVRPIHASNVILKKIAAVLKRRCASLEKENKRLLAFFKEMKSKQPEVSPDVKSKVRITSKGIRKLRTKLGLSQDSFAKLIGVTSQAVYAMEHKEGRIKLRPKTLTNFLAIRGKGKRDARKMLFEL